MKFVINFLEKIKNKYVFASYNFCNHVFVEVLLLFDVEHLVTLFELCGQVAFPDFCLIDQINFFAKNQLKIVIFKFSRFCIFSIQFVDF